MCNENPQHKLILAKIGQNTIIEAYNFQEKHNAQEGQNRTLMY